VAPERLLGWSGWRGFCIVSSDHYDTIDLSRVRMQRERALPLMLTMLNGELGTDA